MYTYDWRSVPRALSPGQKSEEIPFSEHEFIEGWARKISEEGGADKLVIEIGSYYGCSTVILAQFFRVLAIDLWYPLEDYRDETIGLNFSNFMDTWRRLGLKGRVVPFLGSTTYLYVVFPPLGVPLCFIDGDHSYEGTISDLLFAHKHLSEGGYIIVHDYPRGSTIKRAVDEFVEENNYSIIEVFGDGVVVLRKGDSK